MCDGGFLLLISGVLKKVPSRSSFLFFSQLDCVSQLSLILFTSTCTTLPGGWVFSLSLLIFHCFSAHSSFKRNSLLHSVVHSFNHLIKTKQTLVDYGNYRKALWRSSMSSIRYVFIRFIRSFSIVNLIFPRDEMHFFNTLALWCTIRSLTHSSSSSSSYSYSHFPFRLLAIRLFRL
jgi:hypothetical protein